MSFGGFLLYIESESLVLYPLAVNLAVSALGALGGWRVCNGAMFLLEGGGNGLGMESGRVCSRSRSEVSGVSRSEAGWTCAPKRRRFGKGSGFRAVRDADSVSGVDIGGGT